MNRISGKLRSWVGFPTLRHVESPRVISYLDALSGRPSFGGWLLLTLVYSIETARKRVHTSFDALGTVVQMSDNEFGIVVALASPSKLIVFLLSDFSYVESALDELYSPFPHLKGSRITDDGTGESDVF